MRLLTFMAHLTALIALSLISLAVPSSAIAQTYYPGQSVRDTNPLPVKIQRGTATITSGTITTGNTYQTVLAASTARKGCIIQNRSGSAMRLYIGTAAAATDVKAIDIIAGEKFNCSLHGVVMTDEISLTATSSGGAYVVVAF
jgi:hypothetical protein